MEKCMDGETVGDHASSHLVCLLPEEDPDPEHEAGQHGEDDGEEDRDEEGEEGPECEHQQHHQDRHRVVHQPRHQQPAPPGQGADQSEISIRLWTNES